MLLYLKNTEEYQNVTSKMVWDAYSDVFCDLIPEQFYAAYNIDSDKLDIPEELFKGEKKDIKNALKRNLKYYAYQIMEKIIENFPWNRVADGIWNRTGYVSGRCLWL